MKGIRLMQPAATAALAHASARLELRETPELGRGSHGYFSNVVDARFDERRPSSNRPGWTERAWRLPSGSLWPSAASIPRRWANHGRSDQDVADAVGQYETAGFPVLAGRAGEGRYRSDCMWGGPAVWWALLPWSTVANLSLRLVPETVNAFSRRVGSIDVGILKRERRW